MARTGNILRFSALIFVASAATLLIVFTGLADWFDEEQRADVLAINPFVGSAMIADIRQDIEHLVEGKGGHQATLKQRALRYAARVPLNADLRALVADLALREDDISGAKRHVSAALKLDRTNVLAIRRSFYLAERGGGYAKPVNLLDPLFRRNPERILDFQDVIGSLLHEKEGYESILVVLAKAPSWQDAFFYQIAQDPQNLAALAQLLIDLRFEGLPNFGGITASVMNSLFANKQYETAHRLFVLTKSDADKENDGFIFNAGLSSEPSARLFDWSFSSNQSVDIKWKPKYGETDEGHLEIAFANRSLKQLQLWQPFRLPVGQYRLELSYSAQNLITPKALAWQVDCLDPADEILVHPVEAGSYEAQTAIRNFTVQSSACRVFSLRLKAEIKGARYDDRYQGKLLLLGAELTRTSNLPNG